MNPVEAIHDRHVKNRRVEVLTAMLAPQLPKTGRVLDIGSGDGAMALRLMQLNPGLKIEGIDTLVRPGTAIPTSEYDGVHIEADTDSFDACLFVDVLHHAGKPLELLKEAARVCKNDGRIVIKDHLRDGLLAQSTLTFMDRAHNSRYGVSLPCRYWSTNEWKSVFEKSGLNIVHWQDRLKLYPLWANWAFGRGLHVICALSSISKK